MHCPSWFFKGSIRHTVRLRNSRGLLEKKGSICLVVTSPPDLSETRLSSWAELFDLYEAVLSKCVSRLNGNGMLCVIITDRKWEGTIVPKHQEIINILKKQRMDLFAHKILVRTFRADLYRLSFSHVLCFRRRGRKSRGAAWRGVVDFRKDIWGPFEKYDVGPQSRNSFPPEVVKLLVEAFSKPGDTVLDPFCGAGITQRVALGLHRKTIGYDVDSKLRGYWGQLRSV
jgi:tRNA G10  N-methylase Trm11